MNMSTSAAAALLPKVNVSFSGCGFLGVYHIGSYACWKDHQDKSLRYIKDEIKRNERGENASNIISSSSSKGGVNEPCFVVQNALGASAGALVAAALLVDYSPEALRNKFLDVAKEVKSLTFGPFNPKFNANAMFRDELNKVLPDDVHNSLNGRLHISMTDTSMQNVIQSQFSSKDEVMDALICSCYLPAFSAYEVPTFKGSPHLDGGFSNNQPVLEKASTVRISPFAGSSHICPDDGTPTKRKLLFQKFSGESLEWSLANFKRLAEAIVPPENLESLYAAGYQHTDDFIRSGKIREFLEPPASSQAYAYGCETTHA